MRALVVGAAKSGKAVARFFAARGDSVTLTDKRADAVATGELPAGITLELGSHRRDSFVKAEIIVVSPGVPEIDELRAARQAGVAIIGEIELAAKQVQAPIIGITGTNGKSTTTALCGALCERSGRPTFCGGNLGTPFIEAANTKAAASGGICVVELSSFQLETIDTFRPRVAVLLNITPDHLDRYRSMEEYIDAKARLFENQGPADFAIVNGADPAALECASHARATPLRFSSRGPTDQGAFVDGQEIVLRLASGEERYEVSDLQLTGRHNLENAMAAYLAARLVGVAPEAIRAGARGFRALAHRMESVGEAAGVVYFDDSKGTNVGAVVASLDGFPRPFVLIAGGKHKGGDYAPLARVLGQGKCRAAILIGEAAPLIAEALGGVVDVVRAASLEGAVAEAASRARSGDAVVLSPACSSFDMFKDYEHRSQVYRAAVDHVVKGIK